MTTVRLLPTPVPSSASPSNFDIRADAFLGALPDFATDLNAVAGEVNANTTIAYNSAVNAAASELSAANSRDLALAGFGANVWNSLVSYVQGAIVYSVLSYKVYRKITTGITLGGSDPSINTTDWKESVISVQRYLYDNRNTVRSLTPDSNATIIIEGLGMFCWYTASTEIDDDETCFATSTGRWLLEAASPDFTIEAIGALTSNIESRFVVGSGYSGITSIVPVTAASFNIPLPGAAIGDAVVVNPPTNFLGNVSFYASVNNTNSVTVTLYNPSTTVTVTLVDGVWNAIAIKEL